MSEVVDESTTAEVAVKQEAQPTVETVAEVVEQIPETGERVSTGERILIRPAGNRWGIRPEQCLFLEAQLQRRNYKQLLQRIEQLESRESR